MAAQIPTAAKILMAAKMRTTAMAAKIPMVAKIPTLAKMPTLASSQPARSSHGSTHGPKFVSTCLTAAQLTNGSQIVHLSEIVMATKCSNGTQHANLPTEAQSAYYGQTFHPAQPNVPNVLNSLTIH